jgi:hypothetical protein
MSCTPPYLKFKKAKFCNVRVLDFENFEKHCYENLIKICCQVEDESENILDDGNSFIVAFPKQMRQFPLLSYCVWAKEIPSQEKLDDILKSCIRVFGTCCVSYKLRQLGLESDEELSV